MAKIDNNLPNLLKNKKLPKLKKARKSAMKWSQQYFSALEETLLTITKNKPGILMTKSLRKKSNLHHIYRCEQCGDSFHFQSSLKDHLTRFSWIMGYWYRHCSSVQRNINEPSCSVKKPNEKVLATTNKEKIDEIQKDGSILIFYNQCQFLRHLKSHNVNWVDANKIMMMPLPLDIQPDEYPQIENVSKILMKYMFLHNIHIMDWLRLKKINFKWWKTDKFDKNPIADILNECNIDYVNNGMINQEDLFKNNSCISNAMNYISKTESGDDESLHLDQINNSSNHCTELTTYKPIKKNGTSFSHCSSKKQKYISFEKAMELKNVDFNIRVNMNEIKSNQLFDFHHIISSIIASTTNQNNVLLKLFNPDVPFESAIKINFSSQPKITIKIDPMDTKGFLITPKSNVVDTLMHIISIINSTSKLNQIDNTPCCIKSVLARTNSSIAQDYIKQLGSSGSKDREQILNGKYRQVQYQSLHKEDKNHSQTIIKRVNSVCDNNELNSKFNLLYHDWESNVKKFSCEKCNECKKMKKPKYYIIGVSKPAENESDYCQCYNYVCHLCSSKQGSALRYESHLRLHKKETPYQCPECFTSFSSFDQLENHIWTYCNHVIMQQFYSCKICKTNEFWTPENTSKHYVEHHAKIVIYCKICRKIFNSFIDYQVHNSKKHISVIQLANIAKYIKCHVSKRFIKPELYHFHVLSLNTVEKYTYYTCPFCLFAVKDANRNKEIIQKHIMYLHKRNPFGNNFYLRYKNEKPQGIVERNRVLNIKDIILLNIKNTISMNISIEKYFITHEITDFKKMLNTLYNLKQEYLQYVERKWNNSDKLNNEAQISSIFTENLKSLQQKKIISWTKRKYLNKFNIEQSNKFNHSNMKAKQVLPSTKRKTRSNKSKRIALNGPTNYNEVPINYKCHLCGMLINTHWNVLKNHFDNNHSKNYELVFITPKLLKISPEDMNAELMKNEKKRKSDLIAYTARKKARYAFKKLSDQSTSSSSGLCVQNEFLEKTENNLNCKKCLQSFNNIDMLHKHVASSHRIQGHFLICLECGENFVASPSLQMHLKAFHGVDDPLTYMSRNASYVLNVTDEIEEQDRITKFNQCYVCMAVFENKAAVDKHLRVHGMAFLNRRRIETQNALKHYKK
ncbi:uncharacterized protein [Chelonus insularis]|uniref:uncharacterized protein n=1 Tax=Chelonus insularis TaxID=460826 RepID=UPI00158C7B5F|nr:uncharacterized protein LOC118071007 [Chelonus insularis]